MATLPFAEVPGYADALNHETQNRELAFLPTPPPILGIPIRHMSARHHILLTGCRNLFIVGGFPSYIDAAQLLWFLSPDYCTAPGARELFVATHVAKKDLNELLSACSLYVSIVWQDAPSGGRETWEKKYVADMASLVDILAREFHWTDEHILELPLARVFQYLRLIRKRSDKNALMFNPSDKVLGDHLSRLNNPAN